VVRRLRGDELKGELAKLHKPIAFRLVFLAAALILGIAPMVGATTTYTNDPNLVDFTGLVPSYATFSNYSAGDHAAPFTPDSSELATSPLRVYAGGTLTGLSGGNWIEASFSTPVSSILVIPNIDHFGAAYDGFQYTIEGSNDGSTWTALFDALTVMGSGQPFTLGTFTGTAPTSVNNVLNASSRPGGFVGYIARFDFGTAYNIKVQNIFVFTILRDSP